MGKNISALAVSLIILALSGSAAGDIILNGTDFYLSTGDSYGLPQGYVVKLKSVSNEDSIWLELESNDTIVKSEIIHLKEYFTYNKTNRTILSLRVDNIYSGSKDTNLVSFFPVYQYTDPDMPAPKIAVITPGKTPGQDDYRSPPAEQPIPEFMIWITGVIFVIALFYVVRKLW
jgi:hypothetical protein